MNPKALIDFARNLFLTGFCAFVLVSCSEDEPVNPKPISSITFKDEIDKIVLDGTGSTGKKLSFNWTSSTGLIIQNPNQSKAYFKIPAGAGSETNITLTVTDGKRESISEETFTIPALTDVRSFGLGKSLNSEKNNTVPYEWYFDQANTGSASSVNCGPTSVTMAVKWFNEDFTGTPEDARNTAPNGGGWWFTSNIINYLNSQSVTNWTVQLSDMNVLKSEIDNGNIVVLCLDMYYITKGIYYEYRYDKFYATNSTGWGHFIVVKGYKMVDNQLFFEVYDPYSFGNKYADQTLKGRNRYYRSVDLDQATGIWWDYAIVVSKNSSDGGRKGVDTSTIVHKSGR